MSEIWDKAPEEPVQKRSLSVVSNPMLSQKTRQNGLTSAWSTENLTNSRRAKPQQTDLHGGIVSNPLGKSLKRAGKSQVHFANPTKGGKNGGGNANADDAASIQASHS